MSTLERQPMKYPYTISAKLAKFNYRFYWDNFWIPRFYVLALVTSMPLFYYIQKKVNSPGNKAFWREKREQEKKYHFDH